MLITPEEMAEFRADAQDRMQSRVTVRRRTGKTAQNSHGEESPIWGVVHTDLPFRLDGSASSDGGSHTVNVGGVIYEQATAVGHFPATTDDLKDGDYILVTSGEWTDAVYSIIEALRADQKTARRMPIAEQSRPTEWDS